MRHFCAFQLTLKLIWYQNDTKSILPNMNKDAANTPSLNRSYNPVPALFIGTRRVAQESTKMNKFIIILRASPPSGPSSKSHHGRYSPPPCPPSPLASLPPTMPDVAVQKKRTVSVMKAGRVTRQASMFVELINALLFQSRVCDCDCDDRCS